ncbi:MAG: HNH endonuclease [Pedobacter sp.]|nr:HNH endonuclease [Chitinophagaceae bacterium]
MRIDFWTREQLIVALNLYWKVPYNKISGSSNNQIKEVAIFLDRTPAALAYKLMNFTSLDSQRQNIGNKGKSGAGKLDAIIWKEYFNEWDKLAYDSAEILSQITQISIEELIPVEQEVFGLGIEKERTVRVRVNQSDFRQRILASYNEKCCITGIDIPSLLVASHIIPWASNKVERLNPQNGLCLNSIHDKAFDKGLITITNDFKVRLSKYILKKKSDISIQNFFLRFDNQKINLPDRYIPNIDFLNWHFSNRFQK